MSGQVYLTGIVLSAMPVNDYDRRLSILTFEHGRVSAFARGARRPKNQLTAASQPFTYGKFTAYEGKDSFTVTACEEATYFDKLAYDPDKVYYGMYFCELMEYLTRENSEDREQVKLLYTTLSALSKGVISLKLIRRIFELRAISNYGEAPNIFECSVCHKKTSDNGWFLNKKRNVLVCRECSISLPHDASEGHSGDDIFISETVRYTMHYCITSPLKKLYGFSLTDTAFEEFNALIDGYVKRHVDKKLKSLEILEFCGDN
ncbi:MAG: DNA repair protein RecO [Lachnospiraceae bacterium]|nr:DNA repair protein RecO [Lachnospiraceae bacterium]